MTEPVVLDLKAIEARLKERIEVWEDEGWPNDETHAEMTGLIAALREAREALRPIVRLAEQPSASGPSFPREGWDSIMITRSDARHAATVLAKVRDQ